MMSMKRLLGILLMLAVLCVGAVGVAECADDAHTWAEDGSGICTACNAKCVHMGTDANTGRCLACNAQMYYFEFDFNVGTAKDENFDQSGRLMLSEDYTIPDGNDILKPPTDKQFYYWTVEMREMDTGEIFDSWEAQPGDALLPKFPLPNF